MTSRLEDESCGDHYRNASVLDWSQLRKTFLYLDNINSYSYKNVHEHAEQASYGGLSVSSTEEIGSDTYFLHYHRPV